MWQKSRDCSSPSRRALTHAGQECWAHLPSRIGKSPRCWDWSSLHQPGQGGSCWGWVNNLPCYRRSSGQ